MNAADILNEEQLKLFTDLESRGGCSDDTKFAPLIGTGVVRVFNYLSKVFVVSYNHQQFSIMYRIPLVTKDISKDPQQKAKFDNGQKMIAKWIMGQSQVSPDLIPFIRLFFKRHSSTHVIVSIPEHFKKEFLDDLRQTGAPYTQISVDYKSAICPYCSSNNEIPEKTNVCHCGNCGVEFSSE